MNQFYIRNDTYGFTYKLVCFCSFRYAHILMKKHWVIGLAIASALYSIFKWFSPSELNSDAWINSWLLPKASQRKPFFFIVQSLICFRENKRLKLDVLLYLFTALKIFGSYFFLQKNSSHAPQIYYKHNQAFTFIYKRKTNYTRKTTWSNYWVFKDDQAELSMKSLVSSNFRSFGTCHGKSDYALENIKGVCSRWEQAQKF